MTLTFCPPDVYLSIFFDYKEIHNNSSEALFLCLIRSWIIYKYIILCFQVFYRNWCDRNNIALTGVFFFNIFAVLYDVYVLCFTVNGDVACFFSIDTTITWLPFTQFFVSESVLQINIQVLLLFFHVFCKTHLIILLQSEVPMEKYHMILRSHMTSP